jgi:hypothetical protein
MEDDARSQADSDGSMPEDAAAAQGLWLWWQHACTSWQYVSDKVGPIKRTRPE